jgi:hypothetical protein
MSSDHTDGRIRALAFEYAQRKEYLNATPLENWLRAENQIVGLRRGIRPFCEQASERTRPFSEITGRLLTLLTGLTTFLTVVGTLFLFAYLQQIGAPLPPIDSSFAVLVLTLAIAGAGSLFVLVLFFLYPVVAVWDDKSLVDTHRTFFFSQPLKREHRLEYLRQYFRYFLPFLFGFTAFVVSGSLSSSLLSVITFTAFAFLLGVLAGVYLCKRQNSSNEAVSRLPDKFTVVLANFLSFQAACFALFLFTLLLEKRFLMQKGSAWIAVMTCYLLVVLFHLLLKVAWFNIWDPRGLVALLAAGIMWLGPGYLGGKALRFLGLGGGLPIDVTLKSDALHQVHGCLVLSAGNQVIVMSEDADRSCSSASPRSWWTESPKQHKKDSHNRSDAIVNYERSDVLRTTIRTRMEVGK